MKKTPKTSSAQPLDYASAEQTTSRPWNRIRWLVAMLAAVSATVAAWHVTRSLQSRGPAGVGKMVTSTQSSPTIIQLPTDSAAQFYRNEIMPLLDAALQRNRQAADRATELLHARFDAHRAGVKPFAHDVSGWATRLGVIGCSAADLWNHVFGHDRKISRVGNYIQQKFRAHVLSEQSLETDVEQVLMQFQSDVEANRNQLLTEIKLPLHNLPTPIALDDKEWQQLYATIAGRAKKLNTGAAHSSLVTGLASITGGWVGAESAKMFVPKLLTGVGSAVATEAAEAATVTGGGIWADAAAGGGTGTLAGPAGTVVGVGVGLAIGVAIDWWTSDRLESHVTGQCQVFLDTVERQLVEGTAACPGLRVSFEQAIKRTDQAQRQAIIDALMEAAK